MTSVLERIDELLIEEPLPDRGSADPVSGSADEWLLEKYESDLERKQFSNYVQSIIKLYSGTGYDLINDRGEIRPHLTPVMMDELDIDEFGGMAFPEEDVDGFTSNCRWDNSVSSWGLYMANELMLESFAPGPDFARFMGYEPYIDYMYGRECIRFLDLENGGRVEPIFPESYLAKYKDESGNWYPDISYSIDYEKHRIGDEEKNVGIDAKTIACECGCGSVRLLFDIEDVYLNIEMDNG